MEVRGPPRPHRRDQDLGERLPLRRVLRACKPVKWEARSSIRPAQGSGRNLGTVTLFLSREVSAPRRAWPESGGSAWVTCARAAPSRLLTPRLRAAPRARADGPRAPALSGRPP